MAKSSTFKVIYLGQLDIIDPVEHGLSNSMAVRHRAEDAYKLLGKYSDLTPDSVQTFRPGDFTSWDGSQASTKKRTYNQNSNHGEDTFKTEDADGNTTVRTFDATAIYRGSLTYADGTTADNVQMVIVQDTNGHTWLAPPSSATPAATALGAKPIKAVTLTKVDATHNSFGGDVIAGLYYRRENIEDLETVPCFAAGSVILTDRGGVAVEDLQEGDLLQTRDNGFQPIRWIGSRHFSAAALQEQPQLRPIRISAGALGASLPERDLLVSPQHRILVRSKIAQRMFSVEEVLVGAKQLLALDNIQVDEAAEGVTYYHFMCDRHEVVFSNGAETETLYAGTEALKSVGEAARDELFTIFPQLRSHAAPRPARLLPSGRRARQLAKRHQQNRKQLVLS